MNEWIVNVKLLPLLLDSAKSTSRTPVYKTQEEYYDEVLVLKKVREHLNFKH